MRKFLIIIALFFPSIVHAQTAVQKYYEGNWSYVGVHGVIDVLKVMKDYDYVGRFDGTTVQPGISLSAGIYQKFSVLALRYEAEYSFTARSNSYYSTFLANVYLEAEVPNSPIIPYVMAGIGVAAWDPPFANITVAPAFNGGVGVLVPLSQALALDFSVRYMQSTFNFLEVPGYSLTHNFNYMLGIVYSFASK